jgi:hypothetical protein
LNPEPRTAVFGPLLSLPEPSSSFLGLLFHPEDGDSRFLRNAVNDPPDYTSSLPRSDARESNLIILAVCVCGEVEHRRAMTNVSYKGSYCNTSFGIVCRRKIVVSVKMLPVK